MKYIIGFLIGVSFATAGNLLAQSTGIFTDERGQIYQYGTMPGGSVNVFKDGEVRTFFKEQGLRQHQPC